LLVKVEVYRNGRSWCARAIGADIFTQGRTLDETTRNVREAVELHYEERLREGEPITILTLTETEVTPVGEASGR